MKKFVLSLLLFEFLIMYGTYLNYPNDLMYVPTTRLLDNFQYSFNMSQLMATTPYGYKFNTDWFEEDASISFCYHIPKNKLKMEFTWIQYTLVQGSGQYGAGQFKIRVFDDPVERYSQEKLLANPKLKYLPSIAFGLRNITGVSNISPTGNDSKNISNNSFFIVFSKYLIFKKNKNFLLSFGIGGRDFIGVGKMKNSGFFFGGEYRLKFTDYKEGCVFLEYSSRGIGMGLRFIQKNITINIGLANIQTVLKALKENRGIAINVGFGYKDTLLPIAKKYGLAGNRFYIKKSAVPSILPRRKIFYKFDHLIIRPKYRFSFAVPRPVFPQEKEEVIEEEVKLIKREEGIQLKGKSIQFRTGSANILSISYKTLDRIAEIVNKHPDYYIFIEGHTDNRGSLKNNYYLAKSRAESVKSYIGRRLKNTSRVKNISIFSFSFKMPLASNKSVVGRKLNRRVDFYLIKKDKYRSEYSIRQEIEKSIVDEFPKIKAESPKPKPKPKPKEITTPEKKVSPKKEAPELPSFDELYNKYKKEKNYIKAIALVENEIKSEKSIIKKLKNKKKLNDLYFSCGNEFLKKKNIKDAKTYFEKTSIVPNSQQYEDAHYILGQLEYSNGNYQKAIDYFKKVLNNYRYMNAKNYDNDDEAMFKIIACLIKTNKVGNAKELLKSFPKTYPNSSLNEKVKLLLEKLK